MRFQTPLEPATLLRRYKRFLADIRLEDGREVTAHVANPGSMLGLAEPGARVWVEPNDDPKKKLKWSWKLVERDGALVVVDTAIANRVVREALPGLFAGYDTVLPEQRYGEKSRVDFLLKGAGQPDLYVEVKSVTLSRSAGLAEFPDSVTARGARHLQDLADMVRQGHRAAMLYLASRNDAEAVSLATDLDPAYAAAFEAAQDAGVEVVALSSAVTPESVKPGDILPFQRPIVSSD